MNYRGDDLDLRTPQGRASMAGEIADKPDPLYNGPRTRGSGIGPGRSDPIWVDDTVMTACNHAFDLAKAHRSAQVRIEHLLHALTTVDVAAEILEARGVRVAALRRETGALVAGEIPVQLANGKAVPRRSDELEDVLRTASMRAGRRGVAASVDDVLDALLEMRGDIAPITLLRRSGARLQFAEAETPRERVRMPAGSSYIDEPLRMHRVDTVTSATDSIQNSRIESLEQMVRALHSDLIGERKGFSALLQDMQRQIAEQRDDQLVQGQGFGAAQALDRLKSIEHAIEGRLGALEQAVHSAKSEGARNWAGLADRLKGIEAMVANRPGGSLDTGPLNARLAGIEQALKDRLTETSLEIVQLADRLKAIEDAQAAQKTQNMQLSAAIAADVKELGQRIAATPGGGERIQALLGERFQGLAIALDRQRSEIAGMVASAVTERISGVSTALDARQAELSRHLAAIGERINAVERSMTGYVQKFAESAAAYDHDIGEIQQAMLKLNTNQQTLAGTLDQWRLDGSGDLGVISNRVQTIERAFQHQMQLTEGVSAKIDGLYRATAEKMEKRSRFWYWLFGTDSWVRASWQARPAAPKLQQPPPRRDPTRA